MLTTTLRTLSQPPPLHSQKSCVQKNKLLESQIVFLTLSVDDIHFQLSSGKSLIFSSAFQDLRDECACYSDFLHLLFGQFGRVDCDSTTFFQSVRDICSEMRQGAGLFLSRSALLRKLIRPLMVLSCPLWLSSFPFHCSSIFHFVGLWSFVVTFPGHRFLTEICWLSDDIFRSFCSEQGKSYCRESISEGALSPVFLIWLMFVVSWKRRFLIGQSASLAWA